MRCIDNGVGMKRPQLKNYHNIASSAKLRGQGIGFAGVGAKLSLLSAERVITESRGGHGSQSATEWQLTSPYRAPWKYIPFSGTITRGRGTSVTIYFEDGQTHLLKPEFVENTIIRHFYPLLSPQFYNQFLKYFYKIPVDFTVNGKHLLLPEQGQEEYQHWFSVTIGKSRNPAGLGFLVKTSPETGWLNRLLGKTSPVSSLSSGLWISTFGKVIKGGWEWLGVVPKNAEHLSGLVEIPGLAEILTTNKNDFLSDANSLKKYYRFRKAIQEAVLPILKDLGENQDAPAMPPEKLIRPLNKTITGTLNRLVGDFPELESLIGSRRTQTTGTQSKNGQEIETAAIRVETLNSAHENEDKKKSQHNTETEDHSIPSGLEDDSKNKIIKARTTGLKLLLAELSDSDQSRLGRIMEDTLTINTAHPAWQKAKAKGFEEYHVLITVASTLAQFLESEKKSQEFLNRFLLAWAMEIMPGNTKDKLF